MQLTKNQPFSQLKTNPSKVPQQTINQDRTMLNNPYHTHPTTSIIFNNKDT